MRPIQTRQLVKTLPIALLMTTALVKPSLAACSSSADFLTLNCSGTLSIGAGLPITIYDAGRRLPADQRLQQLYAREPGFSRGEQSGQSGLRSQPADGDAKFRQHGRRQRPSIPPPASLADKGLIVRQFLEY